MDWATLTHARIRIAQGDVAGAKRILDELLRRNPADGEARKLLDELGGVTPVAAAEEDPEAATPPPRTVEAADVSTRFRDVLGRRDIDGRRRTIVVLERWLARVTSRAARRG